MRTKSSDGRPLGFFCSCEQWHRFPLYVHAHWTEPITFECPDCRRLWTIAEGEASPGIPIRTRSVCQDIAERG